MRDTSAIVPWSVIVNFEVGGMDGIEIMKEIRQVQPEASIVVIWPGAGAREDEFVSWLEEPLRVKQVIRTDEPGRHGEAAD